MRSASILLCLLSLAACQAPPDQGEMPGGGEDRADEPEASAPGMIAGLPPRQVLSMLGAQLEDGVSERELAGYRRVFGFGDADGDGRHSRREYVDEGVYMSQQARQGIFRAADSDDDGFVTQDEYVLNRIITDEAKRIFEQMDADRDGRLSEVELVGSGRLEDESLAREVFEALDSDGDGELVIPEYLRVWGRWARS